MVLRGDVADLRAASPTRYLEVEFAAPTVWRPDVAGLAADSERRYRAAVGGEHDADALLADARTRGEVTAYTFTPPTSPRCSWAPSAAARSTNRAPSDATTAPEGADDEAVA